jgi:hypothetical protein
VSRVWLSEHCFSAFLEISRAFHLKEIFACLACISFHTSQAKSMLSGFRFERISLSLAGNRGNRERERGYIDAEMVVGAFTFRHLLMNCRAIALD